MYFNYARAHSDSLNVSRITAHVKLRGWNCVAKKHKLTLRSSPVSVLSANWYLYVRCSSIPSYIRDEARFYLLPRRLSLACARARAARRREERIRPAAGNRRDACPRPCARTSTFIVLRCLGAKRRVRYHGHQLDAYLSPSGDESDHEQVSVRISPLDHILSELRNYIFQRVASSNIYGVYI